MAPKVIPVAVLLVKLPCHKGIRGPAVFPQGKAALIVKQDCAPDYIALIFLQNNTSLNAPHLWTKCPEAAGIDVESI